MDEVWVAAASAVVMSPDQMDELWSKPARLARASATGDATQAAAGSRAHPGAASSRPPSAASPLCPAEVGTQPGPPSEDYNSRDSVSSPERHGSAISSGKNSVHGQSTGEGTARSSAGFRSPSHGHVQLPAVGGGKPVGQSYDGAHLTGVSYTRVPSGRPASAGAALCGRDGVATGGRGLAPIKTGTPSQCSADSSEQQKQVSHTPATPALHK